MIPALTGPAIRHRAEQFQQVTADLGDHGRRGRRNPFAVSKDNGRLNQGEAPGMTRICRKTPVIPELRPVSTATRHTRSHRDIPPRDATPLALTILKRPWLGRWRQDPAVASLRGSLKMIADSFMPEQDTG